MWKLTCPPALVLGGTVQIDAGAGSVQVKVTVPEKFAPVASITVASTDDPCATWKLAAVGVRVKSVPAKAIARWLALTEPRPATKLKPVVASALEAW